LQQPSTPSQQPTAPPHPFNIHAPTTINHQPNETMTYASAIAALTAAEDASDAAIAASKAANAAFKLSLAAVAASYKIGRSDGISARTASMRGRAARRAACREAYAALTTAEAAAIAGIDACCAAAAAIANLDACADGYAETTISEAAALA
jgi:hypothetical protein